MISDGVLYRRYLNGEEQGLYELMERHGNKLMLFINGYLHDIHEAEDIMIEVFAYLIAKRPAIREDGLKAYIYKAARNMSYRILSKRKSQSCFCFDDMENEPECIELLEDSLQAKEQNKVLYQCMEKLKEEYREALYLFFFEDMNYKEIAKVMKKSGKQIDNLIQRGKKTLRELLEKEGITDANY